MFATVTAYIRMLKLKSSAKRILIASFHAKRHEKITFILLGMHACRHSHSCIASTQRRHPPSCMRSNALLISARVKLWVTYSSTLISCKMIHSVHKTNHTFSFSFSFSFSYLHLRLKTFTFFMYFSTSQGTCDRLLKPPKAVPFHTRPVTSWKGRVHIS